MNLRTLLTLTGRIAPAALVFLGGCAVGPDFQPPEQSAPGAFHASGDEQPGPSKVTNDPAQLHEWWRMLADESLDSLLRRSIAANLDLKLAEARLREARALRGVVAADQFPTVDANGNYSRSRSSENARNSFDGSDPPEGVDFYSVGFDASWELDFFGRVRRSVEAADADLGAAEEARNDALLILLAEVARNYVELRGFQGRLAVIDSAIQTERDTLGLVEARLRAGLATELDVAQAQAQLATRQSLQPLLRVGLRRTVHRLAVLNGLEPGALLREFESVRPVPTVPAQVGVGMPTELLRRRPDIRRAEREIAAATARVGVATADLYPRFTLLGGFGLQSDDAANLVDMNSRFWSIGPQFTWPVFDAGRVRAGIRVRDAQLDQSLIAYEQTVLTAFEEVENSIVSFIQEQERRASLAEAVEASARAVDLARERYQSGVVDFLNVLDSQRLLFVAQDQLVESDQSVTVSLISLYKALGGGWESIVYSESQAGPAVSTN